MALGISAEFMARPEIPAGIRRSVLVEAGHRCAIPSCRNPDVDVHHIVPWEKCQTHEAENLIALCPNCHRRAHKGEIDRKSLHMYKVQLLSLIRPIAPQETAELRNGTVTRLQWETRKIDVENKGQVRYSVNIEYPYFLLDDPEFSVVNAIFTGEAHDALVSECTRAFDPNDSEIDEWWADQGNFYASSYTVATLSEHLLSVKTSVHTFCAGAAHGVTGSFGKNYFLRPLRKVVLEDQFHNPEEALNAVSQYCISQLEAESHRDEPDQWIREGAGPSWSNFESFVVTNSSIVLLFPPYQVSCFAEGEREVLVSSRFLLPLLAQSSLLLKAWGYDT
jgi:hypothetical protein